MVLAAAKFPTLTKAERNGWVWMIGYLRHALACNLRTTYAEEAVQKLGMLNAQVRGVCEAR